MIAGYYSYYFYENIAYLDNGIIKVADTEEYFTQKNNFEFNKDIRFQNLKTNFKEAILNLANKNKKIILLYPLPESPENISRKIYSFYLSKFDDKEFKEKLSDSDLNIDLDFFYKRSSKIFNFFDEINHKNIAYEAGATNKGIYYIMDKVIKTGSRIAINISEKI